MNMLSILVTIKPVIIVLAVPVRLSAVICVWSTKPKLEQLLS